MVAHKRLRPKNHELQYNVFTMLLDLDELSQLDNYGVLFGYNRRALLSFFDCDHGPATGESLRPWVEERMREAGLVPDGGPVRLLCYPRILGYVFNPLSVYFCYLRDGSLSAILYEVCNTFDERHAYVIPVDDSGRAVIRQSCDKKLYVSPFIAMETTYHFRIVPPTDRINVSIRQEDAEGLFFVASFQGDRSPLNRRSLIGCLVAFPFLTLKVTAGIHWEALLLWAKGLRVFCHTPAIRKVDSSVGRSDSI
jgi:DUF1365 family protein